MEHTDLINEINEYCESAKVSPSTLCVRALGNSRFLDRLSRKIRKTEEDAEKLRAYMAEHPPMQTEQQGAA